MSDEIKRILVVDDEEEIRDAFLLALADLRDLAVTAFDNGGAAVEWARETPPDLVFLDLKMPQMGGVEVLRRLQALYPELPVCIVTAFFESFMRELVAAADDGLRFELVRKPIGKDEIISIVRSYFEGPQLLGSRAPRTREGGNG